MTRAFSPYEQNQLRKYGLSKITPEAIGEKPVEYVTGHCEFAGLDFLVTQDVLIPRIESETIISLALDFIHENNLARPTIADIGTGSGCLGVSLAQRLSKEQIPYNIFLSDISPKALAVAQLNAERLLPSLANIFFQESNLLTIYPQIKFDLLLANMPYIPTKNIDLLDSSVRSFEPRLALDGGSDGTKIINTLLGQIPHFISPRGIAILEIDDTHSLKSFDIPEGVKVSLKKDSFGKSRFLLAQVS